MGSLQTYAPIRPVAQSLPAGLLTALCGSAGLDHSPTTVEMAGWETPGSGFTYPRGSIYDAVSRAGLTWRIYNDDTDAYSDDPQDGSVFGAVPQASALKGVTLLDATPLTHFAPDLQRP